MMTQDPTTDFAARLMLAAFNRIEALNTHARGLSASSLVGCLRRAAYLAAGVEPSDEPAQHPAATLGTIIHNILLPELAQANEDLTKAKTLIEVDATVRHGEVSIPGRADLYSTGDGRVIDLKTGEPRAHHRRQLAVYALGLTQAEYDVSGCTLIYLDRRTVEFHAVHHDFTDQAALWVIRRIDRVMTFKGIPDAAPRNHRGPGLSKVCDGCDQLSRCWPGAIRGKTGAQRRLASTNEELARAAESYDKLRSSIAADTKRKELFAAVLRGRPSQTVGPWRVETRTMADQDDTEALKDHWRATMPGVPLPTKARSGQLNVTRARESAQTARA